MHFCSNCKNMYYLKISDEEGGSENTLIYYCRNCGHIDDQITEEGVCILNTQLKKNTQKFNHIINEYTKMDPTLPRIYNVPCPNSQCPINLAKTKTKSIESSSTDSSTESNQEVIYMRYDDTNMKYLYICTTCDTVWKTDDTI